MTTSRDNSDVPYSELFISDDRGVTFNKTSLPKISSTRSFSLFTMTDPISLQDHLLVSSWEQGIFLSDDLGKTWINFTAENSGLPSDAIRTGAMCNNSTMPTEGRRSLLIATNKGLGVSHDNGQSWRTLFSGEEIMNAGYLSSDCQQIVINIGGIIKVSFDDGATWPIQSPSSSYLQDLYIDSNGNIISSELTGAFGKQIALVIGARGAANPAQYSWKFINNAQVTTSDGWHYPQVINNRLYLFGFDDSSSPNALLSISLNNLLQNPNIQPSDWTIHPLPIRGGGLLIIPNPSIGSIQLFGATSDYYGVKQMFGLNLPMDSDQKE